jgi:DNA excision repair protein ERCC-3
MRPEGRATMYVLATRGSREEDFARQRMRHLAQKGVRVTEQSAQAVAIEEEDASDAEGEAERDQDADTASVEAEADESP